MFIMSHRLVCHLFVLIRRQSHTLLKLCEIEMFTHCPTSCHPLVLNPRPSAMPTASICARIIKISKYYQTFNRCFFSQVTTVTELSVTSDTGQCRPGQARSGQAGRAEQQPSLALLCSLFLGTGQWWLGSSWLVSLTKVPVGAGSILDNSTPIGTDVVRCGSDT